MLPFGTSILGSEKSPVADRIKLEWQLPTCQMLAVKGWTM